MQHTMSSSEDSKVRQLEELDDIIFPAIDGDETALRRVEPAWECAIASLGSEAVQESRLQYLRHAWATWAYLKDQAMQRPHHLLAVMQIIMMLSGEDVS